MAARSAECRCDHDRTCAHCLRNAPVYFYTPRTWQQIIADQIANTRRPAIPPAPTRSPNT